MRTATSLLLGALALTAVAQTSAEATERVIRRDTVVPVVFNETIDAGKARVGDRFSARVDGGRDLPKGARLTGRIDSVSKQDGRTVLSMRFDEARLGDGSRYAVDALPVPLNADFLKKTPDGRIRASRNDRSRETKVLGGLVGGFVLGTIIGKQKEATILGTLLGAGAALLDRDSGKEIAVKKGQRYGAMFEQDATISLANRLEGDDPYAAIRREDRAPGRSDRTDRDRDERDRDAENRTRPRLYRNGRELVFEELRPVRRDGTLYLPVREAARVLDLTFADESRTDDSGTRREIYTIEGNDRILELDEERGRVRLDGRRKDDVRILRIGEALYLPMSAFSPLVQDPLTSDASSDEDGA